MNSENQRQGLIILDRDGTLIEHVHHLVDIHQVKLIQDSVNSLAELMRHGFRFAMVTNQSVIGRGLTTLENVQSINNHVKYEFQKFGVTIEAIKVCPHTPWDGCICRKPSPYLGNEVLAEFEVEASNAWMIGDQLSDFQFGQNLKVKTCIFNPNESHFGDGVPHFHTWPKVVSHILGTTTFNL